MTTQPKRRIAVFGPHPDDQELGMGGTIALLAKQGHDILIVDMTNGEPTPLGSVETRTKETAAATKILTPTTPNAGTIKRILLGLPNRTVQHTIEARHLVASTIRAWQADTLFVTYPEDAHPDHRAVTRIVEDARFDSKLTKIDMPPPTDQWTGKPLEGPGVLTKSQSTSQTTSQTTPIYPKWLFYYYATHLRWVADPTFLIDITETLDTKIDAINAYETQFVLPEKNRRIVDWVKAAAVYFGSRIGTAAAEPFYTKEPIGLSALDSLS